MRFHSIKIMRLNAHIKDSHMVGGWRKVSFRHILFYAFSKLEDFYLFKNSEFSFPFRDALEFFIIRMPMQLNKHGML